MHLSYNYLTKSDYTKEHIDSLNHYLTVVYQKKKGKTLLRDYISIAMYSSVAILKLINNNTICKSLSTDRYTIDGELLLKSSEL